MTDMGDDFRAMRDHKRKVKNDRESKFEQAFSFISSDANRFGITVARNMDGSWSILRDGYEVTWWPSSGKTSDGDHFHTWPELKAHMLEETGEAML